MGQSREDGIVSNQIGRLMSGFAKITPPNEATLIHTSDDGLTAGAVWVPVADGEIPAYRAKPQGPGLHPVLLLVQEVFGCDDYLQDTCRRAADAGLYAIAPELYVRQGEVGAVESREGLFDIVSAVPDAQVMSDLDAAAAFAATDDGDASRLAVTGFCWGGRIVWLYAAHNPNLKAGIAWYGRIVGDPSDRQPAHPIDVAAKLNAPVLGLYGAEDQGIPLDTVERMKAALAEAGNSSEFVVYDGAPHAFHADYRPSYVEADAKDGWRRLLSWLKANGVLT
jgi:carboxymethylenebutenolidase